MVRIETVNEELLLTRAARRVTVESLLCCDSVASGVTQRVPAICEGVRNFDSWTTESLLREIPTSRSVVLSDQVESGWISYIREMIYAIPEVEKVYVEIAHKQVDVWVIIPKRNIAVVRQIAQSQGEILRVFASAEEPAWLFDFHVVYRDGRDESQFVPALALQLPKPT